MPKTIGGPFCLHARHYSTLNFLSCILTYLRVLHPQQTVDINQWRGQDFGARRGTKLKRQQFKGDTQKYYEFHAINSDKAIYRPAYSF